MHGVVNFTQNNSKPKKGSFVVKEAHGREDFEKLINDMEKKGFDLDSWNMTPAVRETLAGPVQTILFFGVFSISLYVGEWNPGPEDANANTHLLG